MRFYATEDAATPITGYPFLVSGPDKERLDDAIAAHEAETEAGQA